MTVEAIGCFLASEDAPRLVAWYKALGFPLGDKTYCTVVQAGEEARPGKGSVFSVMPAGSGLAGQRRDAIAEEPYGSRRVMLNVRVRGMDGVVEGLRSRGDEVAGPRDYDYGRFAWVQDPDGNVVELWEPAQG